MTYQLDHREFLAHDFAIVDPFQVDAELWQHVPHIVLGSKEFDCDEASLPRLLALQESDELTRLNLFDAAEAFTADSDTAFFGALLKTSERAKSAGERLSRRLVLRGHASSKLFFRYFDPRVFTHLPRILEPAQLLHLIEPASAWSWFDPITLAWRQQLGHAQSAGTSRGADSRLSTAQLDGLARVELVNRVVHRLRSAYPDERLTTESPAAIDAHVRRAVETESLRDADDQVLYAVHAVRYGEALHRARLVREVLARVQRNEESYAGAMSAFDDNALQEACLSASSVDG